MKNTIGIIMVALGCLCGIGFVGGFPRALSHIGSITAEEGWTTYVYGYIGGQIFVLVAAYLLITFGLRLRKKELSKDS